jgi:uncharacterized protein
MTVIDPSRPKFPHFLQTRGIESAMSLSEDPESPRDPIEPSSPQLLGVVPLFPLPNVVLLPRAVLPLHIFEQRYRAMTAQALAGDRRIAMALLRTGWEKNYYGRPPIEPVVCVGRILSHERLEDGRYNLLLQGECRASVAHELASEALFRQAELHRLNEEQAMEIDLQELRGPMEKLLQTPPLAQLPLGQQLLQCLEQSLPTSDLADLLAFHLIDEVAFKQSLLAETNVRRRVEKTLGAVQRLLPSLSPVAGLARYPISNN